MIINYYKNKEEPELVIYYDRLENPLTINEDYIHTLYEDRNRANETINNTQSSEYERRIAHYCILSLTSSASNDIYEGQMSQILGIKNIVTKHGWDANDENNNEPYEYKPTKIDGNCLGTNVNINDESEKKINNISPHKVNYNNYEANYVIAPINNATSEFICIYKFKEHILYRSRMDKLETYKSRKVYGTNIKKCIELSEKYNEKYYKWHNPKFMIP